MKRFSKLTFLSFICCAAMCSSQEEPVAVFVKEYESCCGTQPVEFAKDGKQVYIPNVFTPNKDGLNDLFFPAVNAEITDVWAFRIYNAKGDSVIYEKIHFYPTDDIKDYGWNGLDQDGKPYKGLFKYKMRLDNRVGLRLILEGQACAVVCEPKSKVLATLGCFFPAQAGKEGTLNKLLPNLDLGCFL